jgi:DNA-binding PadR family transcriptional regulator
LLDEEVEMTPSGYTRYVYSVTRKGRKLLEDAKNKRLISKELEKVVKKIVSDYGTIDLSKLVQEAYRRYNE